MFKKLALTAILLLFPVCAWAGSYIDGIYNSNLGYTVRPPSTWDGKEATWDRVDVSTMDAMKNQIPKNIAFDGLKRFDVVFFPRFTKTDTSLKADSERIELNKDATPEDVIPPYENKVDVPEFYPSVSILVLKNAISDTTSEMAEAYKKYLLETVPQAADYARDFKIVDTTKDVFSGENGFLYKIQFKYGSHDVDMEQIVLSRRSSTYIITCTKDTNSDHVAANWCKNVANSMVFQK